MQALSGGRRDYSSRGATSFLHVGKGGGGGGGLQRKGNFSSPKGKAGKGSATLRMHPFEAEKEDVGKEIFLSEEERSSGSRGRERCFLGREGKVVGRRERALGALKGRTELKKVRTYSQGAHCSAVAQQTKSADKKRSRSWCKKGVWEPRKRRRR